MNSTQTRTEFLKSCGATPSQLEELLEYNTNYFNPKLANYPYKFPLPDEIHINVWKSYLFEAQTIGLPATLKKRIIQFQFPIEDGISQTEAYQSATRKGSLIPENNNNGLFLKKWDRLQLRIHQSIGGSIPVFITTDRTDFESLIQAFLFKNEPKPVPKSMGACMVAGFNNWDRIFKLKEIWEKQHAPEISEALWQEKFKRIIPNKELYQDRFIILSDGPYSAVPAVTLGLSDTEWKEHSLKIRLAHECAHYFTKRFYSSMRNNLLDELIADFMGITNAIGMYRADWFLHFIGLEKYPSYRSGGRLENYRSTPPLSDSAFRILQHLAKNAAENLEVFCDTTFGNRLDPTAQDKMLLTLTQLTIDELASPKSEIYLQEALMHTDQVLS
ncbi:hypothetical protein JW960_24160 [candidate division KSB1 bacterium]|nr:hypothetical protein [candidate division KSB1 bacterium]